jgi:PPOX class probable F420-dependent enzyme
MAAALDGRVRALLDGPNLAHVATTTESGAPCVQPTWVSTDGTTVWLNTIEGRRWPRRLRRDPRVALSIVNAADQAEYVEIRGRVVQETSDGADAHIDALANTYIGIDYPNRFEGEQRLVFRIEPEKVSYVNLMEHIPGVPDSDAAAR